MTRYACNRCLVLLDPEAQLPVPGTQTDTYRLCPKHGWLLPHAYTTARSDLDQKEYAWARTHKMMTATVQEIRESMYTDRLDEEAIASHARSPTLYFVRVTWVPYPGSGHGLPLHGGYHLAQATCEACGHELAETAGAPLFNQMVNHRRECKP